MNVEECREHLGKTADTMSDKQIIQLRDALIQLIDQVLDKRFNESQKKKIIQAPI